MLANRSSHYDAVTSRRSRVSMPSARSLVQIVFLDRTQEPGHTGISHGEEERKGTPRVRRFMDNRCKKTASVYSYKTNASLRFGALKCSFIGNFIYLLPIFTDRASDVTGRLADPGSRTPFLPPEDKRLSDNERNKIH